VVNFPIMRYWYIVYRSGKRLSLIAQAFQKFVREESAQILKVPVVQAGAESNEATTG
jgi:hypothetical protein